MPNVQVVDISDSERWGIATFRTYPQSREDLRAHEDSFVIARIDANRMDLVQYALKIGYLLCDTLTYWKGSTDIPYEPLPPGYWWGDLDGSIANGCFGSYQSHYSADPRTKNRAWEVYSDWAKNWKGPGASIEHESCQFPMVKRTPVAFGLFKKPCELSLAGVLPEHNGKGLYAALVRHCAAWGAAAGVGEIEISTQVTNLAVQRVWAKLGLRPYKHVYTLHRWP